MLGICFVLTLRTRFARMLEKLVIPTNTKYVMSSVQRAYMYSNERPAVKQRQINDYQENIR